MDRMDHLARAYARKRRNPLDYVDGVALGAHLRGGVDMGPSGNVTPPQGPPIQLAGTRRKRPGGRKPYER